MLWMLLTTMMLQLSPDPFTYASQATGVPVSLLVAVSRVESSHHPWALNIKGEGVYPQNQEEAENILRQTPDNVDIGHMQVNYRVWGKSLGLTRTQLLDPYINAWAGAVILRSHLSRYPFWEAVGRYHSGNENRMVGYAWKIYRALVRENNYASPESP